MIVYYAFCQVFVDVTLSCEGGSQLRAHKVVLAACSPYFQVVLQNNPCKHPIIILPREVVFADLRAIIEFVYRGEIDVAQEQIHSLLQVGVLRLYFLIFLFTMAIRVNNN